MSLDTGRATKLVKSPRTAVGSSTLSRADAQAYLAAFDKTPLGVAAAIAISCGPGRAELLGLKWRDVYFDARTIHFERCLERRNENSVKAELAFKDAKTLRRRRTVTIPLSVLSMRTALGLVREHLVVGDPFAGHSTSLRPRVGARGPAPGPSGLGPQPAKIVVVNRPR